MNTPAPAVSAQPLYFGPEDRRVFGWLHDVDRAATARVGLVIVAPFGYEAICAHRSLRHFAAAAAAAGVPTMRFDLDGTGDSAGDDRDSDRVAAWLASIDHAADTLRRATGVERVCFLGVRTGALLAATAAARRADVAGVIAIAPVVSGRLWAREMKALQMAMGLAPPPPDSPPSPEGEQEVVGFRLSPETRDALAKLELVKAERKPAQDVLIVDRNDLPPTDKWADHLRALGATVTQRREPGYVEMVLDPHLAQPPVAMIGAAVQWLRELCEKASPPASPGDAATLPSSARMGEVTETALFIDAARVLFGVVTAPASGRHRRAIVLLNAGAIHHIGPNRLHVALARRWAALGHLVLRLDISGIGDSNVRARERENDVYTARGVDDVAAAIAYLRAQPDVREVYAVGLCSGAYNAFKAAVAGHSLTGIVPINPLTFFWKEGMPLDYAPHVVAGNAQRYAASARDWTKWTKLLRGDVNVRAAAEIMVRRGASIFSRHARDVARRLGRPFPEDLGAELESIASRGIELTFVFGASDPGLELLRVLGGSSVRQLVDRGAFRWHVIEGSDHTFTPIWSHAVLIDRLAAILDGPRRSP